MAGALRRENEVGTVTRSIADPKVAEYIQSSPEAFQELIHALREVVYKAEPQMDEAIKWRRVTFTLNGNWHHWICGIERTQKYVSFIFHKGALLDDPSGILQGVGQWLRMLRVTSPTDIPTAPLIDLIRQAALKQTDME